MTNVKQVEIKEKSRMYDVKLEYHSDLMCENHDAEFRAIQESDGRITFIPNNSYSEGFVFNHSDPDRVIALASMMKSFAKKIKKERANTIDISDNV